MKFTGLVQAAVPGAGMPFDAPTEPGRVVAAAFGTVALTKTGRFGRHRPHAADSADCATGSCSLGVRGFPVPAGGDRAGGPLVPAVRAATRTGSGCGSRARSASREGGGGLTGVAAISAPKRRGPRQGSRAGAGEAGDRDGVAVRCDGLRTRPGSSAGVAGRRSASGRWPPSGQCARTFRVSVRARASGRDLHGLDAGADQAASNDAAHVAQPVPEVVPRFRR
jgi:hypothetical protein